MHMMTKARLVAHLLRWRISWKRRNTRKAYIVSGNPKFMSARDAIGLIQDGDMVALSGLGGNQRASVLYWAMRELFEETGHPHDLQVVCIGGHGGRGKMPGTVEEIGQDGLVKRFISGHLETFKSFLKLADEGRVELQCLPQGVLAFLIDGQTRGEDSLLTETGVGTFVDPRVGRGTPFDDETAEQWVAAENGQLRYTMPKVNVALFNAPAADREGNIYIKNCAMIGESLDIARAAKKNGGKVIVNVGLVVDKGYDEVFLPADMVDAVVVFSGTEQSGSVPHRRHWPMFALNNQASLYDDFEQISYLNRLLGVTPRRTAADAALARLAATVLVENINKGALINIGTGLPEEVCRLLAELGLNEDMTFFTESGVVGGLPAPGIFFGVAVSPEEIIPSSEVFKRCYESLDFSILGVLQADSDGNVNVSKRGEGAINYVGPGGFIDFTTVADTICFISSWMAHAKIDVVDGKLQIAEQGKPKFVEAVDEITFNGRIALEKGKRVFYVTHVGVFQLTERGMELVQLMPGIDLQKDILDFSPMRVALPESGEVPVVDESVVTGEGFSLRIKAAPAP